MKIKGNILYTKLNKELKAQPHYIATDSWVIVKSAIQEFSYCLTDLFLTDNEINLIVFYMETRLDQLAEITHAGDLYTCHSYINDCIDFYAAVALSGEYFETVSNINKIIKKLAVKISVI